MMQDDLDAYVMASEDTKAQLEAIKTENDKLKEEVITAHNEVLLCNTVHLDLNCAYPGPILQITKMQGGRGKTNFNCPPQAIAKEKMFSWHFSPPPFINGRKHPCISDKGDIRRVGSPACYNGGSHRSFAT